MMMVIMILAIQDYVNWQKPSWKKIMKLMLIWEVIDYALPFLVD